MAGRKEIPRELSIYINDRQVINSLGGVTREITKVNAEMRNLNKNSSTYDEDLKRLQKDLSVLKDRQAEFKEEIQATTEVSNEAAEAVSKIFIGLTSGNLNLAKEGIEGIRGSVSGLTKSAMAFIATPIGAAIAVLSGVAIAAKAVFDFNQGLQESNKQLKALGVNSEEISKVRSEISATAETFDKEFADIAEKANSLSKAFGISMSEANQIIAEGLANGGAQNAEFLDSLGEYDEFFSKAGFSAQEFANIINTGFELGIYTDKLPDALKEADLSLKEQTKATRDALVNAFGAQFSDDILNKVRTGELTTKQALQAIAKESEKTQLSQQQQAQLTADVFKGAGEDAGGALKIFQAIGQSAQKELSDTAKAQLQLVEANERLNKAQAELFEIKDFGSIWDVIKTKSIDALSSVLEYIIDLKKDIQPLIDLVGIVFTLAWENLKTTTEVVFDFIGGAFRTVSNTIKTFVEFFKAIFKADFRGALDAIKNGFFNLGAIVKNTFGGIYNVIVGALQGIVKTVSPILESLGIDVDKLQKKLESFKVKEITLKTNIEDNTESKKENPEVTRTRILEAEIRKQIELLEKRKAREEALGNDTLQIQKQILQNRLKLEKEGSDEYVKIQNEILKIQTEIRKKGQQLAEKKKAEEEKAAKEEYDRLLALANAKAKLAKAELDAFILNNRTRLEQNQQLTPELIAEETKRLEAIQQAQLDQLIRQRELDLQDAANKAKSAEELAILKLTIDTEYETARQNLELGFQQTTDALKKQYEEQQKQLQLEQLAADNELALLEAQTKEEEAAIKAQQQFDADIARYRDMLEKKKITQEEYDRFEKEAKENKDALDRQRELNQLNSTLGGIGALAGAVTQLFGQSKEMALVSAGINGAQAITSILAQWPKFDGGFSMYAAIAASVITTAAQVKEITKAKAPKQPKLPRFFFGGNTGTAPALGFDEHGPVTGVVHSNEWVAPQVMTQSPRYAPILSYLETERQRIMGNKFADGGSSSPGTLPPAAVAADSNSALLMAINRLNANLESGIKATARIGYEDAEAINDLVKESNESTNNGTLNS